MYKIMGRHVNDLPCGLSPKSSKKEVVLSNIKSILLELNSLFSCKNVSFVEVAEKYNQLYLLVKDNINSISNGHLNLIKQMLSGKMLREFNFKYKFGRLEKHLTKQG